MKYIDAELLRKEIERRLKREKEILWNAKKRGTYPSPSCEYNLLTLTSLRDFLDTLPEQPVSDHHEIEVEFRGEKVTISREFYRNGERNYSTSEQDDNAIWSALRAWCEKKGITPFELYPKQPEQPVYGLEEEMDRYYDSPEWEGQSVSWMTFTRIARHFAEWQKKLDDLETADLLAIAHLQGMEQQKSKMMEDAVECVVENWNPEPHPEITIPLNPEVFGVGDKVRVIVIKED